MILDDFIHSQPIFDIPYGRQSRGPLEGAQFRNINQERIFQNGFKVTMDVKLIPAAGPEGRRMLFFRKIYVPRCVCR